MKRLGRQFKFDVQREIFRNIPFLFFSILMPAGFYILFTRVMVSGTKAEMAYFYGSYMCNMIVYSQIISAFFGLAVVLHRDRQSGYQARVSLTPPGLAPYYCSIALCFTLMSVLSIVVMGVLAIILNGVQINASQFITMLIVAILGQLPFMLIGLLISRVNREETLSVFSNLLTFPLAIISGLWWPISMLPNWLQTIGKLTPTYRLNRILNDVIAQRSISGYDGLVILIWVAAIGMVMFGYVTLNQRRGRRVA